ncbi:MAG: nitrilase-related carbon-nitrogen hydrolase [Archangium sp.]
MRTASKWWLSLGVLLVGLAHMRWGIGALAFVAPIPFLVFLRAARGARDWAWFGLALFLGYCVAIAKIITAPIPFLLVPAFALPIAALAFCAYFAWSMTRSFAQRWVAPLVFAGATVVTEAVQHRFTEFGSWGTVAYTQLDDLPLLQVSSLVGMAGVSFLVSWVAASLESARAERDLRPALAAFGLLLLALAFGVLRLGFATTGPTVTVAAIGTDSTIAGFPYPPPEELERINERLFARTAEAATRGAKLVGWTEAATLVPPRDEAAFMQRLSAAAASHHIELVAAWVVPDDAALRYENKLAWVRPDGSIAQVYRKHHPVPGEPATPGTEPHWTLETAAGRASAAICYDFDFPALARAEAQLGVDLVVVPSSDWKGIDPLHTQMASVRAIENGFSLLRPTRWGLSAGFDAYGRVRGWQSSFDAAPGVLLIELPARGVATLYTAIGDAFVGVCAVLVLLALSRRLVLASSPTSSSSSLDRDHFGAPPRSLRGD